MPVTKLTPRAHHVHGSNRRIISLMSWPRSARPRNRRSTITIEPTTVAMPMMWNDWAIGGRPGTLPSRYTISSRVGLSWSVWARKSRMGRVSLVGAPGSGRPRNAGLAPF